MTAQSAKLRKSLSIIEKEPKDRDHEKDTHYRVAIVESLYVEHLHTSIRFLVGVPTDKTILLDYAEQVLFLTDHLNLASGITLNNIRQLVEELADTWLKDTFSILVTDCFEVFGICSGRIMNNLANKRSIELDGDYSDRSLKSIKSTTSSEDGNFIKTFLDELLSFVPNFLPDSCQKYVLIDLITLHPEYQGVKLGHRLIKEMLRLAKKSNLQFVVIICTTSKLRKICEKFNFQSKLQFPYSKFISNEESVYLMIADLNEISELLKDEPPRLPNAYKLLKLERELLDEIYVDRLGRKIRYEIGLPEDEPVIREYMSNEYFRQTNILRTLQCRKEDISDLISSFHPEFLKQGNVILAIDKGHLCGISVNRDISPKDIIADQTSLSSHKVEIPEDFTALIDSHLEKNIAVKSFDAINAWMESLVPLLLPSDCDKLFILNNLSVHPDYTGCKIANNLWIEALKLGRRKNIRYVQCICSAIGSSRIAEKIGLKMAISLPYSNIIYKGQLLFENGVVNDGTQFYNMFIGDLNDIFNK